MKLWISEYESVPQLFQSILYIITNILWTHFNIGGFQWIWLPEYELGCSPAAMMWMIKLREDPLELLWLYKRANNYIVMVLQACTSNLNVPVWDNFSWAVGFRIEMYLDFWPVSFWPHRRINVSSLSVEAERSCRALRQEQTARPTQSCSGWTSCRWPCRHTQPPSERAFLSAHRHGSMTTRCSSTCPYGRVG